MDSKARKALATIQRCVEADRFLLLPHFRRRLTERGLVWPDALAVLEAPTAVVHGRSDRFGRDKWIVTGVAADGLAVELVCVLDLDEHGRLVVFITAY